MYKVWRNSHTRKWSNAPFYSKSGRGCEISGAPVEGKMVYDKGPIYRGGGYVLVRLSSLSGQVGGPCTLL